MEAQTVVDGLLAGHTGSHRPQGSRGCVRSTVTVHRATRGPARGEQQLRELQTNSLTFADGGHDDGSFRVFDFCSSSPAPRQNRLAVANLRGAELAGEEERQSRKKQEKTERSILLRTDSALRTAPNK